MPVSVFWAEKSLRQRRGVTGSQIDWPSIRLPSPLSQAFSGVGSLPIFPVSIPGENQADCQSAIRVYQNGISLSSISEEYEGDTSDFDFVFRN